MTTRKRKKKNKQQQTELEQVSIIEQTSTIETMIEKRNEEDDDDDATPRRNNGTNSSNPNDDENDDNNSDDDDNGDEDDEEGEVEVAAVADESQPADWASEGPTKIVQRLAMYRFVLFMIMVKEYVFYLPWEVLAEPGATNDPWFTYDQFDFLYRWSPKSNSPVWGTEANRLLYFVGIGAGGIAAFGGIPQLPFSYELSAFVLLSLYAFKFFAFVHVFTNHNYLFLLLGILLLVSGGGSYYPPKYYNNNTTIKGDTDSSSAEAIPTQTRQQQQRRRRRRQQKLQRLIQKSEWGAILVRIQYAIVYLFASIWKMTPDWLDGSICKGIFLTFEEQDVGRGVPWKDLYEGYGMDLFRLVAVGGFVLDTSMFLALTFRRPSLQTTKLFTILSILFHGFVCFTMSERIGYSFPTCCLAGSLIFHPIGNKSDNNDDHSDDDDDNEEEEEEYARSKKDDDYQRNKKTGENNSKRINAPLVVANEQSDDDEANLIGWIHRYVTGSKKARASLGQRCFAIFWFVFQMAVPLRMPIITQGTFPYTSRCYRFSWTMMLHSRFSLLIHKGTNRPANGREEPFTLAMDMMNLYPECADVVPIMRSLYQAASIYRNGDPRTLPLIAENHGIVGVRHRAVLDQFPRHVARVAGGWSELLYQRSPNACYSAARNESRRMSVYGSHFSKLNNKGAYCRIFDPTVNLAKAERRRKRRTLWETIKGVVLDMGPPGYEYLLTKGIGSMTEKTEEHRKVLEMKYPNVKRIEFIADRAACLAARPFSLWPAGFPMAAVALEVPHHVSLQLSQRQLPEGMIAPDKQWDSLSEPVVVTMSLNRLLEVKAAMFEVTAKRNGYRSMSAQKCGDTTEEDTLFALLFLL